MTDQEKLDKMSGIMITNTPIPTMLLTPLDWALESQRLAAEYAGLPEGKEFLVACRRFIALDARIRELEKEVSSLKELTSSQTE